MTIQTSRCVLLLFLLLFLLLSGMAQGADIGQDGGITLVVSFEDGGLDCGTFPPPVDKAGAEAHYCEIFEQFSQELYWTTEGTHWIKRVRFMESLEHPDIFWHWITRICNGA